MKELLLNPFAKYSESKLLVVGILFLVISVLAGFSFDAVYDGVLDLHFRSDVPLLRNVVFIIVDAFVLCFCLVLAAKFFNRKTRVIDILVAVLISRVPIVILPFFNFQNALVKNAEKLSLDSTGGGSPFINFSTLDLLLFIVFALFSICLLVWQIALLYNGYRVASNGKNSTAVVLFIASLVLAELISKFIISYI
jgi:hypothetical protein